MPLEYSQSELFSDLITLLARTYTTQILAETCNLSNPPFDYLYLATNINTPETLRAAQSIYPDPSSLDPSTASPDLVDSVVYGGEDKETNFGNVLLKQLIK